MSSDPAAGGAFFLGHEMEEPEVWSVADGVAAVFSTRAPGKESPNEDAVAVLPSAPGTAVLAVADGAGGQRSGSQASELAVRRLARAVADAEGADSLRSSILDGIERANESVQALGVGAATTLAAVEISAGLVRPYHVGDSVILVVGQRGKLKLQTVAHSPVGFALEAGVMDEDEAMHHEDRHVVSNVLGNANMRIEVGSTLRLAPRDSLLLASDGLSDNLHVDEIAELVRAGNVAAAAARLASEARRRMSDPSEGEPSKPDDLSFILFRPTGR